MESEIQSEELKEGGGDGKFSGLAEDEAWPVVDGDRYICMGLASVSDLACIC